MEEDFDPFDVLFGDGEAFDGMVDNNDEEEEEGDFFQMVKKKCFQNHKNLLSKKNLNQRPNLR